MPDDQAQEDLEALREGLSKPPTKPGYKTTEFWLTIAAGSVGAFLSADIVPNTHWAVKVAGLAATVLSVLGYQVQRTKAKK